MKYTFESKWRKTLRGDGLQNTEEESIFVDVGKEPQTQRQLNLYYYFLFIKDVLKENGAKDVLELGCGRGTTGLYLAKHEGLTVALLDSVPEAIEIAKKFFAEHGQRGTFYVSDAIKTGLGGGSFDAVVSIGLAEHFESKDEVVRLFEEERRLLKPGGVMVSLNIPGKPSIQFLNTWMRFFKKLLGSYKDDLKRDYYRNSLSPEEYEEASKRAGFTGTYIVHTNPFPFFVPIRVSTDRKATSLYKFILKCRALFQRYPYKTNRFFARSHFLVGYKQYSPSGQSPEGMSELAPPRNSGLRSSISPAMRGSTGLY